MKIFKHTSPIVLALSIGALSATAADFGDLEIHGFISQGYVKSSEYNYFSLKSKEGSLQFNEMGINFSTELSDELRAGIQILSRDFGEAGNNQVTIDWAYGDYLYRDWLGFRAGRVKTPAGLYSDTRDIDMVRTSIFLPTVVYEESLRDFHVAVNGAEIYGTIATDDLGSFQYLAQAGYSDVDSQNSGLKTFYAAKGTPFDGLDPDMTYAFKFIWNTPLDGLRLGTIYKRFGYTALGTMANGLPTERNLHPMNVGIISAEYLYGNLALAAEGVHRRGRISIANNNINVANLLFEDIGGYVSGSYRCNDWLELGTSYSYLDEQLSGNITHDIALSSRFDLTDNWILKFEGHYVNGVANTFDAPVNGDDWLMFAMKTTFSF
ncbi:MAG: hypothetical protein JXR23_08370 [Pontiellaceae bacterium]|nr:hypothetical protein [Pontiellaceae bacterium]